MMKKILILIPYYYPGFRSGGPQQTIRNMVEAMGDKTDIYICTQDHDFGCKDIYIDIETEKWIQVGKAKVMYVSTKCYRNKIKKLYDEFTTIYSCGLFEFNSIILLCIHRQKKVKNKAIYIAPMGVFSEGALNSKRIKKQIFLSTFKYLGMFQEIVWSFTSGLELNDARRSLGNRCISNYIIAEDLPKKVDFADEIKRVQQKNIEENELKIVFLSRICPKKNLSYCLDILEEFDNQNIIFDIYGIKEDEVYWNYCETKIEKFNNVKVRYCGEVVPDNVVEVFSQYDVFLFPTKGENFGHVIYESLSAGCVPIISDKSPWVDLDKFKCGFVVSLCEKEEFVNTLKRYFELKKENRREYSIAAIKYAALKYDASIRNSGYLKVLS